MHLDNRRKTMGGKATLVKTIPLEGTKNGLISISKIEEPYGEGSDPVASIGISLSGDATEPEWKVHLPLGNLDAVIEALQTLK
jgi:hypothetical protein